MPSIVEHLRLEKVERGASFLVQTGSSTYNIRIIEGGIGPLCEVTERNNLGQITAGPTRAFLLGTGFSTTPEQNPTQNGDVLSGKPHQDVATTINHGVVKIGGHLIIQSPDDRKMYIVNSECTRIAVGEID